MTTQAAATDAGILHRVVEKVRSRVPDAEVILFGSRAEGRAQDDSDYDFLIIANTEDRWALMLELTKLLQTVEGLVFFDILVIPRADWDRVRKLKGFVAWEADQHGVRLGV